MKKDGGPAFPGKSMGFVGVGPFGEAQAQYEETPGMTLRDWFAGQTLVGWLASFGPDQVPLSPYTQLAAMAYAVADAMIEERSK